MPKKNLYEVVKESLPESAQYSRVWLSFIQCFNSIDSVLLRHFAHKFNASLPRYDILTALVLNPDGLTMGELAILLMVTKGNVTGVVRRLEQERLVTKEGCKIDRRVKSVKISNKGVHLWEEMHADYDQIISDLLSGHTQEQVATLMRTLEITKAAVDRRAKEFGHQ